MTGNVMEIAVNITVNIFWNAHSWNENDFTYFVDCSLFYRMFLRASMKFFQTTSVDRRELRAFDATKNDTFATKKNFDTKKIRHCSFSIEKDPPILYRGNFKNILYRFVCILKTRAIRLSKKGWKYTRFKYISGAKKKIGVKLENFIYREYRILLLCLIYTYL